MLTFYTCCCCCHICISRSPPSSVWHCGVGAISLACRLLWHYEVCKLICAQLMLRIIIAGNSAAAAGKVIEENLNNKKIHGSLAIANLFRGKTCWWNFWRFENEASPRTVSVCVRVCVFTKGLTYVRRCVLKAHPAYMQKFAWVTAIC